METGQVLTTLAELVTSNTTIANKQDKTDNTLNTTDKTIVGSINEINNKELSNETIINSHVSDITNPHNTNLSQLKDIIIANPTDKQVLGYNLASSKFINQDNVDEKVKITSTSSSKYLGEWLDGVSIQNIGSKLVCKSLDGMDITLVELNRLSGIDKNIMDYLNAISNPMTVKAVVNTYTDLASITSLSNGNVAIVKSDGTHDNKQWTYIYINSAWNSIAENTVNVRDFSVDKLDLISEVKNKLPQVNIDMTDIIKTTDLANYLKVNDASSTYATITQVGLKANNSDIYTQTQTDNLLNNKANSTHTHVISDVTNLQSTLDNKLNVSNIKSGTNVTVETDSNNNITINSTATGGSGTSIDDSNISTSTTYSSDKINYNYVSKVIGKQLSTEDYTTVEKTKLANITGTNTGDETQTTIKTKIGSASTTQDGCLTSIDWNTFNNKQNKIFIQSTQPTIATDNIWIDNTNPISYALKVCNSTSYIQVGNSSSGSVQEIVIQNTQPSDTTIKLWLDTSSNPVLKWYNGTSWISIGSSSGHVIKDSTTTTFTQRKNLKFTGSVTITDNPTDDATIIDVNNNFSTPVEPKESIALVDGQDTYEVISHTVGSKYMFILVDGVRIPYSDYTDVDSTHIQLKTNITTDIKKDMVITSFSIIIETVLNNSSILNGGEF